MPQIRYRGNCKGGPMKGQLLDRPRRVVRYHRRGLGIGRYIFDAGRWNWEEYPEKRGSRRRSGNFLTTVYRSSKHRLQRGARTQEQLPGYKNLSKQQTAVQEVQFYHAELFAGQKLSDADKATCNNGGWPLRRLHLRLQRWYFRSRPTVQESHWAEKKERARRASARSA